MADIDRSLLLKSSGIINMMSKTVKKVDPMQKFSKKQMPQIEVEYKYPLRRLNCWRPRDFRADEEAVLKEQAEIES